MVKLYIYKKYCPAQIWPFWLTFRSCSLCVCFDLKMSFPNLTFLTYISYLWSVCVLTWKFVHFLPRKKTRRSTSAANSAPWPASTQRRTGTSWTGRTTRPSSRPCSTGSSRSLSSAPSAWSRRRARRAGTRAMWTWRTSSPLSSYVIRLVIFFPSILCLKVFWAFC